MIDEILLDTEVHMSETIDALGEYFVGLRTGRASPGLASGITVDYYGSPTPLGQIASIGVEGAMTLVIEPYDKNVVKELEKALGDSDLGAAPQTAGTIIRLTLPALTRERREALKKTVRGKAEDYRASLRSHRHDALKKMKMAEKDGELSEDDLKRGERLVKELIDKYGQSIHTMVEEKEAELSSV